MGRGSAALSSALRALSSLPSLWWTGDSRSSSGNRVGSLSPSLGKPTCWVGLPFQGSPQRATNIGLHVKFVSAASGPVPGKATAPGGRWPEAGPSPRVGGAGRQSCPQHPLPAPACGLSPMSSGVTGLMIQAALAGSLPGPLHSLPVPPGVSSQTSHARPDQGFLLASGAPAILELGDQGNGALCHPRHCDSGWALRPDRL